jgi:hypothetical protein
MRELMGGKSGIAFSYRIVGRRKDVRGHRRFAKFRHAPTPARLAGAQTQLGGEAARIRLAGGKGGAEAPTQGREERQKIARPSKVFGIDASYAPAGGTKRPPPMRKRMQNNSTKGQSFSHATHCSSMSAFGGKADNICSL